MGLGSGRREGVKRGAWSKEEDALLKKCIGIYGEGRWQLVPLRAGLNRCRKSCRLRWVNYLSPDIKKGNFTTDEVDLLRRLHKLLGNRQVFTLEKDTGHTSMEHYDKKQGLRWSLIAGRIPGRTANDVKNFWNTHLAKASKPVEKKEIIKPKPYRLAMSINKPLDEEPQQNSQWCGNVHEPTETNKISEKILLPIQKRSFSGGGPKTDTTTQPESGGVSEISMGFWKLLELGDI